MIDDANNTYALTVTDVLSNLKISLSSNIDKITDRTFECRRGGIENFVGQVWISQ